MPAAPATTRTKLVTWTYDTAILGKGRAATATHWVGANAYTSTVSEYDVAGRPKGTSLQVGWQMVWADGSQATA